ncbi:MAG TPA: hypothetical protein VFM04_06340, partial [Candidatus Methylomirabilis sp.]|nr:hypothetical protein [Candidatus Methylomirabilis sp.]
ASVVAQEETRPWRYAVASGELATMRTWGGFIRCLRAEYQGEWKLLFRAISVPKTLAAICWKIKRSAENSRCRTFDSFREVDGKSPGSRAKTEFCPSMETAYGKLTASLLT